MSILARLFLPLHTGPRRVAVIADRAPVIIRVAASINIHRLLPAPAGLDIAHTDVTEFIGHQGKRTLPFTLCLVGEGACTVQAYVLVSTRVVIIANLTIGIVHKCTPRFR
jgi:hypothetical protein